jgi:hypothetical protein
MFLSSPHEINIFLSMYYLKIAAVHTFLYFFQLCLQNGCAEKPLLSRNVPRFQDNAYKLCPCNGTVLVLVSLTSSVVEAVCLELTMPASNVDKDGWVTVSCGKG